jgi:4-amino-4-deoxy-L-arabinose transferase-like glycosyltransferase
MLSRPLAPPCGLDGLPLADPREERVARAIVIVATVWFTLAAAWEMFGPILAGHYAAAAGMGIIAENMLRWHILGPVWEYTTTPPSTALYYCHHPWGIFWTTAALMRFLGRHDYLCRLAPVLLSAATPPLLYAIGRAIWRPAAGAAAAASFVVLPITLAFAGFNGLEVPVMTWTLLGLWGFVRMTQTGTRKHLAAAVGGVLLACNSDWAAFLLIGALLSFGLVRGFLLPTMFGKVRSERRYRQWWALTTAASVLTLVIYLAVFKQAGKLDDLFGSYGQRSSGNAVPLDQVLLSRRYWIELSFTPIAIALGKLAAVVSLIRLLVLRREHEVVPLAYLAMATAQYLIFKQGADIHIFWPQYFGAYFALGMGALVATLAPSIAWISRSVASLRRRAEIANPGRAGLITLGVAALPIAAIARDGLPALRYAHETGGRFNEKGLLIHSDGAKTAFLKYLEPMLPRTGTVDMHEGMKTTWAQVWALNGRPVAQLRPLPVPGHVAKGTSVYLADTRFLLDSLQGELASSSHVTAVGPFWKVTPGEAAAPIDAYSFAEREPSWWEWYFVSGTEPHREIVADPWLTWELRTHFGQPAVAPSEAPVTLEQKRIAHNIAVAAGDEAKASALLEEIGKALTPVHAKFDDGSELWGTTYHEGARSLLTLYVLAGGPSVADVQLAVRSRVLQRATLSLTVLDAAEREVGIPVGLAPQRWKKGFLYSDPVAIRKRPGTEVFRASYWARGRGVAPKALSGGVGGVEVLTLR